MSFKSRRTFLKTSLASMGASLLGQNSLSQTGQSQPAKFRLSLADRFLDPLPIPKVLTPYESVKGTKRYGMRALEFSRKMHPSLPATRLWGYEGQYPGPIIEAVRGEPIEIVWENRLPKEHLFAVDPHIHGAMPPAPHVRISPHVHGSRTSSESDGLPEKWFAPGETRHFAYPNEQQSATLWYHDHALGITRLNVYAGLSGFFLLRDPDERKMELPAGDYEIPLLLQDRTLDEAGHLVYSPTHEDGKPLPPGTWGPEFFGDLPVVNGVVAPYCEVEPRRYRLRFLNGSNSRFFNLFLNLAKSPADIPSLVTMHQIGTDGGFLPAPVELARLLLGTAERADVLVDFSTFAGKTVTLSNDAPSPYPGWMALASMHEPLNELLQFRVVSHKRETQTAVDFKLQTTFHRLDESAAVVTRDFILSERLNDAGQSLGVRINDKNYDDPVTETVKLGTIEKWRFINTTDDAHPMHLHLVQFHILHRQGYDPAAMRRGSMQLVGAVRPPGAHESGWKDTAVVSPNEILTILVPFEGFVGRYVFHCHMLEHEDNDMMRPYVVVE